MSIKRNKSSYVDNTVCHQCKEPVSVDAATRSLVWAYGLPGVRWLLCSQECAQLQKEEADGD